MAISGPQERSELDEDDGSIFAEINVTPLVDVMLVLLIIFMVSTTIITEEVQSAGIKVDLPKSSAKGGAIEQGDVIVALTKEGQIVHAGEALNLEQLKTILETAKAKNPKTVVIVQADREVQHGRVTEVLDLARSLGLEQLAIATEASE
ncbi:MAG: biopolymer transporter ExbD [Deltaproteobacteria bacterium]|nr:biopolymer transporter ExbD [Deltaproteobacteria bacterium]